MTDDTTADSGIKTRITYHTVLLGGMALIFSALITLSHMGTHEDIKLRLKEDMMLSLSQVLPPSIYDNKPLEDTLMLPSEAKGAPATKIYRARKDGNIVGVAYEITGQGYGGAIVLIMGVDSTGKILGVRVISHHETPGLGDNIEVSKSDWITKFKGLFFGKPPKVQWKVKKDGGYFDQFTGATITPRGVVKAIKRGLQMFIDNRAKILNTNIKTSINLFTVLLRRYC